MVYRINVLNRQINKPTLRALNGGIVLPPGTTLKLEDNSDILLEDNVTALVVET